MLPPLEYLAWAIEHYVHVKWDLGTSGLATLPASRVAPAEVLLAGAHDPRAPQRWIDAIARRFAVDARCVVPTLGTTHGLWATYAALLSPGDEVVVESPAYEPLVRLAEGVGARVVSFERDLSRGAPLEAGAVARVLTDRTKLVVVSNLHNPTGAYATDDQVRAVAEVAARVSAPLLVDEVYRDLVDHRAPIGVTAFGVAPNVLVTSSLTKVYGLGWARAGWVLAPPHMASAIYGATLHDAGGVSWGIASIGAEAISRIDALWAITREAMRDEEAALAKVHAFVAARPHLHFVPSRGSVFGFVRDARGHDLRPTIERAIRDEQVIVAPGSFFGAPAGFRLRYAALAPGVLDEGLRRLGRALDASS